MASIIFIKLIPIEIKKAHDREDGVLKVTIPADSDTEEGDYVKLTKVEENEDAELTDGDAVDSAPEISIPSPPLLAPAKRIAATTLVNAVADASTGGHSFST